MPGTVTLHRVMKAPPERIYRAFLNADALAKWLPPDGFTGHVFHMDAKVGGGFKMAFTSFASGGSHSFSGAYKELIPNEKLRYVNTFDDPNLSGEMMVTILLKAVSCGTEFSATQSGIPDMIPVEMCYLGWQDSLRMLAALVETAAP